MNESKKVEPLSAEMADDYVPPNYGASRIIEFFSPMAERLKAIASGAHTVIDKTPAEYAAMCEELEQHRTAHRICKSEGWESPEEVVSAYKTLAAERDALRSELAKLKAQEPVAHRQRTLHRPAPAAGAGS